MATEPSAAAGWTWDPSLYAGAARFYAVGRAAYPRELADGIASALGLDGRGRLIDVGCGPGSLTLLLAVYVAESIGVDADADMLTEAARLARAEGVANVGWRQLRGEDLPADLPAARLITFAQSFHWMDRPQVARAARALLEPGGAVVHVAAMTHAGVPARTPPPHPEPPREAIAELVQRYLGAVRRAGQGVLASGTPSGEDAIFGEAGFTGPERLEVPGQLLERSAEQVVASVYSLSSAAPHLFGDRLAAFDADLRRLLAGASADGRFSEQMGTITASLWR